MSKDTALNDLPQETPATQTSLETFNAFLNAPVTKLDADEYMAKDIDGVTESLLGSGNLNFLMMQAGQTDEAIANTNPFDVTDNDLNLSPTNYMGGSSVMPTAAMGTSSDFSTGNGFGMGALDGASSGTSGLSAALGDAASGMAAIAPAGGSYYASSALSATGTGINGNSGTSGISGDSGLNGSNGIDGNGGDTTINNTTNNATNNVTNVTENTLIDNSSILESVENIYNDTTHLLTEVVNDVTDIVNNIFDGNPLDIGPIGVNLDGALDDLLNLNLDFINGDQTLGVLDEAVDLSPATNLVDGLTGDILANAGLDVIVDPLQYDDSPNDYDIHAGLDLMGLDLPSIDLPLDAVEFLTGDIDIGFDAGQDVIGLLPPILGGADNGDTNLDIPVLGNIAPLDPVTDIVDGLFNPVEDFAGDFDILGNLHADLLGLGEDGTGADTDLTMPLDLNLLGTDLLTNGLEIPLDPVENLLGDADLDLGVAGNLLGDTADSLIDSITGGTGTENLLGDLGGTLGGSADGILPMEGTADDTDILLNAGTDIPGAELLNDAAQLMLDPVENIVGDIDVTGSTCSTRATRSPPPIPTSRWISPLSTLPSTSISTSLNRSRATWISESMHRRTYQTRQPFSTTLWKRSTARSTRPSACWTGPRPTPAGSIFRRFCRPLTAGRARAAFRPGRKRFCPMPAIFWATDCSAALATFSLIRLRHRPSYRCRSFPSFTHPPPMAAVCSEVFSDESRFHGG